MSSKSILELAHKHAIEVPITEVVVSVLYDNLRPREGVSWLMNRAAKAERHGH
jgi:glycerol-3-phosphate dehydrogenase (NAD(P)+)